MAGRPKGSKNTSKHGGLTLKDALKELGDLRNKLYIQREESRQDKQAIDKLQQELKQLKISPKPKYQAASKLTLTEDMVKDAGNIVSQGVFEYSRIAGFLGINKNTFQNWINDGNSGFYDENDLRTQLVQMIDYRKEIFYLTNQTVINNEIKGDPNKGIRPNWQAAKWNLEARFAELRTNNAKQIVNINDGMPTGTVRTIEDQKVTEIKKEMSVIISESILSDDE